MKPTKVEQLPRLYKEQMAQNVLPGYDRFNKAEAALQKKQKRFATGDQQERPGSGRSDATRLTGGLTGAFTQITGTRSTGTAQEKGRELEAAMQQLSNKDSQLASFIKYDTTLGREQNIEIAKESSLANSERIQMRGGVKLTQFHPEKKGQQMASTIEETGDSDDGSPISGKAGEKKGRKLTWEEQIIRRQHDETAGKREPLQPANINDGGAFKLVNRMSRIDYQKHYNHFGTIGRIED